MKKAKGPFPCKNCNETTEQSFEYGRPPHYDTTVRVKYTCSSCEATKREWMPLRVWAKIVAYLNPVTDE